MAVVLNGMQECCLDGMTDSWQSPRRVWRVLRELTANTADTSEALRPPVRLAPLGAPLSHPPRVSWLPEHEGFWDHLFNRRVFVARSSKCIC